MVTCEIQPVPMHLVSNLPLQESVDQIQDSSEF